MDKTIEGMTKNNTVKEKERKKSIYFSSINRVIQIGIP